MFIVYILCKNRKIFYRGCFCAFLAGQRSHLLIFIAVIFGFSFFYLGQTFFAGKRCFRPILYRPFLYRPILRADSTKNSAHAAPLQRGSIWHAAAPHERPPLRHAPNRLKTILLGPCTANLALFTHTKAPTQKTPGVIPGVWLMKNSFNLLLTHCGRFLAGCTGPACSRRPQ